MQLSVKERFQLLGILPRQGNIVTLRLVTQLQNDLALSEDELIAFKVREAGDRITWDESLAKPKNLIIGEKSMDVIINALNALNHSEQLNLDMLGLYERFVEKKDAPAS